MYYSYAMGIDESVYDLRKRGFIIEKSKNIYRVTFPKEQASAWEEYIANHLVSGYWNDYLADDHFVFLFHSQERIDRYEVYNFENDKVLSLCENFCGCRIESLESMLLGNLFYQKHFRKGKETLL